MVNRTAEEVPRTFPVTVGNNPLACFFVFGYTLQTKVKSLKVRSRGLPSVRENWYAHLPVPKAQVFSNFNELLETAYIMFSVALNEAFELKRTGDFAKSMQAVGMTGDLCVRLSLPLGAVLHGLGQHAKHYGFAPRLTPLCFENFHGVKEQRIARMSDLLSRVLLTHRSQFLHKISTLEEMVSGLNRDYRLTSEELASGPFRQADADWKTLDNAHYDLNTCLREAIVLLKSFLVTLPEDQVGTFQRTVRGLLHEESNGSRRSVFHRLRVFSNS